MDDTRAAPPAGAVHVEEGHAITFAQSGSIECTQRSAHGLQRARGHVTGDDRIGNTAQTPVPEMHVGAAHLRSFGAQQRSPRGQIRCRELAQLDGLTRRWHDGSEDAIAHIGTLPLIQPGFHLPHMIFTHTIRRTALLVHAGALLGFFSVPAVALP